MLLNHFNQSNKTMLDVIDHRQSSQASPSNTSTTLPNLNIKLMTTQKLSAVSASNPKLNKITTKLAAGYIFQKLKIKFCLI